MYQSTKGQQSKPVNKLPKITASRSNYAVNKAAEDAVFFEDYVRATPPENVYIHYGPTNSGKTYESRNALIAKFEKERWTQPGSGVYASPLRMLAYENYETISERVGAENVGLMTGEESINPDAPIICSTMEMVPQEGKFLIVDEAHWLVDLDRGAVWTRAIRNVSFEEVHIISAVEAKDLVESLVQDAKNIHVTHHTRFNELAYDSQVFIKDIPERSAVICFSKKLVHMIAQRLLEQGKTVAVLYGALPPYSRREQINRFISGEADYIVTTDVIGHGINLPVDNIVFAETMKFDGATHRPLRTWELAQIAGRAGRFGLTENNGGKVFALKGIRHMENDIDLIKEGVSVANGKAVSDLLAEVAYIAPTFRSLGVIESTGEIHERLRAWSRVVPQRSDLCPVSLDIYMDKLIMIEDVLRFPCGINNLSGGSSHVPNIQNLWKLLAIPVEVESDAFIPLASHLLLKNSIPLEIVIDRTTESPDYKTLDQLERSVRLIQDMRLIVKCFSDENFISADILAHFEAEYALSIDKKILDSVADTRYGYCHRCQSDCAPWMIYCSDTCHSDRSSKPPVKDKTRRDKRDMVSA